MAEKSTILSKKFINKTFNTFPSTKSKESKQKKSLSESSTSFKASTESTECLDNINRKSSIFSNRFINGKQDKLISNKNKLSIDKNDNKNLEATTSKELIDNELNKSLSLDLTRSEKNKLEKSKSESNKTDKIDNSKLDKERAKSIDKSSSKTNKYTSFFTSSSNASKSSATSSTKNSKNFKQTTTLSTISSISTNSSLHSNSPIKSLNNSPIKSSKHIKSTNQSISKFKFNKKKITICNEQQQWHTDSQLTSNNKLISKIPLNKPVKLKDKSSSQTFRTKTAKTLNTFVKPIKKSTINKRLLFTSSIKQTKPKIIEELDNDFLLDNRNLLNNQLETKTTTGLKVSFDDAEMKIDRHRSNSDNSSRISKKQNLISSLRRSIFANPDLNQHSSSTGDRSLSTRMRGMITKGKSHLAIVRSHSLESNKFSSKRKNQQISKSQSKLIPQPNEPNFDENNLIKFLPLKWSFVNDEEDLIYIKFFKFYRCYDLMSTSTKLVIFDTQLPIKKAFSGLVTNGIKAVPLWDSINQKFTGMLTISYFINILIDQYEKSNLESTHFEENTLDTFKDYYTLPKDLSDQFSDQFISIEPDNNVFDAINLLIKHKIHRLPVITNLETTGSRNVIYILTHKRILKFLYIYYSYLPKPKFLQKTIFELKIGTFSNIETVTPSTCLLNALNKFIKKNVSSLPIIDNDNKLLDVFCKFDLFNLAANKMYSNLDISIKKALEQRVDSNCELLVTCFATSTLNEVIELFVHHESHRLIIVDENDRVTGIICLSDVLKYLISEYSDNDKNEKDNEFKKKHETNLDKEINLDEETNLNIKEMNLKDKTIKEEDSNENDKNLIIKKNSNDLLINKDNLIKTELNKDKNED